MRWTLWHHVWKPQCSMSVTERAGNVFHKCAIRWWITLHFCNTSRVLLKCLCLPGVLILIHSIQKVVRSLISQCYKMKINLISVTWWLTGDSLAYFFNCLYMHIRLLLTGVLIKQDYLYFTLTNVDVHCQLVIYGRIY